MEEKMKIFVDADSCPVKKEVLSIAAAFSVPVIFVASIRHQLSKEIGGTWKYVDPDDQAADMYIFNHLRNKDLLVTQDIGLASLALSKGAFALSVRGYVYEEGKIESDLQFRYLAAKARRAGRHTKGPKALTNEDVQRFMQNLERILSKVAGI